jgi:hypothetical protein
LAQGFAPTTVAAADEARRGRACVGAESRAARPIAARVATVLELPQQRGDASSVAMVQTAVQRSHKWLEQIDFEARLDPQRRNMAAGAIGAVLFVSLLLIVVFPSSARLWAARLFAGSNEPWPQRTYLQVAAVKDGLMIVPRGEPFVLRALPEPTPWPRQRRSGWR